MHAYKNFLWVFWIWLIAIWIDTLLHLWQAGYRHPVFLAVMTIPCWVILFFAEGLELAVAARVVSPTCPVKDPHTFFTRRQALVILPITFISLATGVYPWLQVPGFGRLHGNSPFWFSLALVSLTTLWFAQVVPKRLAVFNPDLFLRAPCTPLFLGVVTAVGALFGGPSDDVVHFAQRALSARGFGVAQVPSCECAICEPMAYEVWSRVAFACTCSVCSDR